MMRRASQRLRSLRRRIRNKENENVLGAWLTVMSLMRIEDRQEGLSWVC